MSERLDKLDDCAAATIRLFQQEGQFAILLRTTPTGDVRMINPNVGTYEVYRLLVTAAEQLMDGHVAVETKP